VRAPELEADRAAELDELRLVEVDMQARPELVGRGVGIPDDRGGPLERDALASLVVLEVDRVRSGDVREAQLLELPVDETGLEDAALDVRPRLGRTLVHRERVLGADARHSAAAFSPPRPSEGSSSWPTPHVLITRCWP